MRGDSYWVSCIWSCTYHHTENISSGENVSLFVRGWLAELRMDATHWSVYFISWPELHIREAMHQLGRDHTHQVAASIWSIIGIVHPEGCTSARPRSYTSSRLALLPELCIRMVVHQLIKDGSHQLAFSGMIYHRFVHPAVWCSLFRWCLRGLYKRAVQQMHRKQLSSFHLCLKVDFEFLPCI